MYMATRDVFNNNNEINIFSLNVKTQAHLRESNEAYQGFKKGTHE